MSARIDDDADWAKVQPDWQLRLRAMQGVIDARDRQIAKERAAVDELIELLDGPDSTLGEIRQAIEAVRKSRET